ncbi:hypothetical protein C8Q75DRAFT_388184 [Abortiporus biennis]|nr:hypothetical protein C8Q75DRAFT_388184 [Abortiporus biennis]
MAGTSNPFSELEWNLGSGSMQSANTHGYNDQQPFDTGLGNQETSGSGWDATDPSNVWNASLNSFQSHDWNSQAGFGVAGPSTTTDAFSVNGWSDHPNAFSLSSFPEVSHPNRQPGATTLTGDVNFAALAPSQTLLVPPPQSVDPPRPLSNVVQPVASFNLDPPATMNTTSSSIHPGASWNISSTSQLPTVNIARHTLTSTSASASPRPSPYPKQKPQAHTNHSSSSSNKSSTSITQRHPKSDSTEGTQFADRFPFTIFLSSKLEYATAIVEDLCELIICDAVASYVTGHGRGMVVFDLAAGKKNVKGIKTQEEGEEGEGKGKEKSQPKLEELRTKAHVFKYAVVHSIDIQSYIHCSESNRDRPGKGTITVSYFGKRDPKDPLYPLPFTHEIEIEHPTVFLLNRGFGHSSFAKKPYRAWNRLNLTQFVPRYALIDPKGTGPDLDYAQIQDIESERYLLHLFNNKIRLTLHNIPCRSIYSLSWVYFPPFERRLSVFERMRNSYFNTGDMKVERRGRKANAQVKFDERWLEKVLRVVKKTEEGKREKLSLHEILGLDCPGDFIIVEDEAEKKSSTRVRKQKV